MSQHITKKKQKRVAIRAGAPEQPLPETPLDEMNVGDWFEIELTKPSHYNTLLTRLYRFKTRNDGYHFQVQSMGSGLPRTLRVYRVPPPETTKQTVRIINGSP